MPWNVEADNPDCDGWAVVVANDGGPNDGGVVGCHATEAEAIAQQKALYARAEKSVRPARTFRVPAPAPARRSRQFAGVANVPRDGNGRWTRGGGGGGGVSSPGDLTDAEFDAPAAGTPDTYTQKTPGGGIAAKNKNDAARRWRYDQGKQFDQSKDLPAFDQAFERDGDFDPSVTINGSPGAFKWKPRR